MEIRGFDIGVAVTVVIALIGGARAIGKLEQQIANVSPDAITQQTAEAVTQIDSKLNQVNDSILRAQEAANVFTTVSNGTKFTRRQNVFVYNYLQEDVSGNENTEKYFHITTPDKVGNYEMWRYDLRGYAYGNSAPIDLTWVGYFYGGDEDNNKITRENSQNRSQGKLEKLIVSQYVGSKGNLVLKFGPISHYYLNFVLDYQSGGRGEKTPHISSEFKVQITTKDVTI